MELKEYYKSKDDEGKKQIFSVLELLDKSNKEFMNIKRKTPWVQKSQLWREVGQVNWTHPETIDKESPYGQKYHKEKPLATSKPFTHYTTFERLLWDLCDIGIIEEYIGVVWKCPKCKEQIKDIYTICIFCGKRKPFRDRDKKKPSTFYRLVATPKETGFKDIVFTDKLYLDWYDEKDLASIPHVHVYGIHSTTPFFVPRMKEIMEEIKKLTLELYQLKKENVDDSRHIVIISKSTAEEYADMPIIDELYETTNEKRLTEKK